MDVAFLGTGLMGAPMARRLLETGHRVSVYNRSSERAAALADAGAHVAASPASALDAAEWVLLMLTDAAAIEQLLLEDALRPRLAGRRVVNMATIAPTEARALATRFASAGAEFMECPVLGSIPEAREGRLLLMFGGTAAQLEAAGPLLSALGPAPLHVGELGKASAVKLAMNQLIASLTTAFALSLGLVQREGVEPDVFMQVVRNSALYAPTFDKKLGRMLERDFNNPNFPVEHLLKDVRLAHGNAAEAGLDTRFLTALEGVLQSAADRGLSRLDYSALYEVIAPA